MSNASFKLLLNFTFYGTALSLCIILSMRITFHPLLVYNDLFLIPLSIEPDVQLIDAIR